MTKQQKQAAKERGERIGKHIRQFVKHVCVQMYRCAMGKRALAAYPVDQMWK